MYINITAVINECINNMIMNSFKGSTKGENVKKKERK